ncbi:MAG: fasciclin domain-containing protein [Bacteroidales bacterium]|nr:fasciclin domain-containing protein [Bacteroidales bacterium]
MAVLTGIILLSSCTKKWEEHYNEKSFNLPDNSLNESIRVQPDLHFFSRMLDISGYDSILDASVSYTVWAPVNDALSGIDTTNIELVKQIVENHIALGTITTSGIISRSVRMINGKYIKFARESEGFSFGDNMVVNTNLPAINGLIYFIDGYTPYLNNIWEYIRVTPGLDSLWSYLNSQNKYVFDPENMEEIGYDSTGAAIYDSNLVMTNLFIKRVGAIDNEDSIYTAILADNTAWNEAYSRIDKYFNFPSIAGGDQRQRDYTGYTLTKDILFKKRVTQPQTLDSLVSTTGTIFLNPGSLFNTSPVTLSNGLAYVTDQLPFADTISFFKEIKVEAENTEGRDFSGSAVFLRTSYGSDLDVSDNEYILVDPISEPRVVFSIPNTLSAKYNMYCVFVPAVIVDPLNTTPTKARFRLRYIRRLSGSTVTIDINAPDNITNPLEMTKMFIGQFNFEFANIIDEDYEDVMVELEVINAVTAAEEQAGTYSRTMRIDCIIFEPVSE